MAEKNIERDIVSTEKGKGKAKAIQKTFHWTEPLTLTFLETLRYLKRKNGYGIGFCWAEICGEFENRTKKAIIPKIAQNKYNTQKKLWTNWGKIRHMESGVGWNEQTGCIVAEEEWWQKKKLELGDAYSTFRRKGVKPEISDLWDDIFTELVASGKHVVAASMDPDFVPLTLGDDIVPYEDENSLDHQLDKDAVEDNIEDFENTLNSQPCTNVTAGRVASQTKAKTHSITTERQALKRKRKQSPASAMYNEQLALVGETGKQMLSLMKSDFEASNAEAGGSTGTYDEAVAVLNRLVKNCLLSGGSGVWCFAMTELVHAERRRVFMKINNDEYRVSWLQHEYAVFCRP